MKATCHIKLISFSRTKISHICHSTFNDTELLQQLEDKDSEKEKGRKLWKKKGPKKVLKKCTEKVGVSESSNSEEES